MSLYAVIQKGFLKQTTIYQFISSHYKIKFKRMKLFLDLLENDIIDEYGIGFSVSENDTESVFENGRIACLDDFEYSINKFIKRHNSLLCNLKHSDIIENIHLIGSYVEEMAQKYDEYDVLFETYDFSIIIIGKDKDEHSVKTPNLHLDIVTSLTDENYHTILRNIIKKRDSLPNYTDKIQVKVDIPDNTEIGDEIMYTYKGRYHSFTCNKDMSYQTRFTGVVKNDNRFEHSDNHFAIILHKLSIHLNQITIKEVSSIYKKQDIDIYVIEDDIISRC